MPHPLEYVVDSAMMLCDHGLAPAPFTPDSNTGFRISGALVSIDKDIEPITHVPCFGICSLSGSACTPVPVQWEDTFKAKVAGGETLLFKSKLPCSVGGTIEFLTSGQVPLPPEELDALFEAHSEEIEEEEEEDKGGWGFWDYVELVPVVGSVVGIVREAAKGNWGMVGLNTAFLVFEVATMGTGSALTAPAKGGAKVALKTSAKISTKSGARRLVSGATEALGKAISKKVDDIAKALAKQCVYACFAAGTKVATEDGLRPIETIKAGDLVWAFDEETKTAHLRKVIEHIQKTVDVTVTIRIADEEIVTTAEHPFYTEEGWRDAADLEPGDQLMTKEGNWHAIQAVEWTYEDCEVFNFTVAGLHTYYVGAWQWLVHNAAAKCLRDSFDAALDGNWKGWTKSGRRQLRNALGTRNTGNHAHHVIPCGLLRNDDLVQQAYRNGFDFHGAVNGRALPMDTHLGRRLPGGGTSGPRNHNVYNRHVQNIIDEAKDTYPNMKPEDLLQNEVLPELNRFIDDAIDQGKSLDQLADDILNP